MRTHNWLSIINYQLSVQACYSDCTLKVEQLGSNSSVLDGFPLGGRGEGSSVASHGSILEFLEGEYKHKIVFHPNAPSPSKGSKRPMPFSAPSKSADNSKESSPSKKSRKDDSGKSPFQDLDLTVKLKSSNDNCKWELAGGEQVYIMTSKDCEPRKKVTFIGLGSDLRRKQANFLFFDEKNLMQIAAFDLDSTLICTKSGKVFPVDKDDWRILYPEIPGKLKKLHSEGYKIVIISNKGDLSTGKITVPNFMSKTEAIVKRLGVPLQMYGIAANDGPFRKPRTGVWSLIETEACNGEVDLGASFYCGDAAGRLKDWAPGKKKDFSCTDRLFAVNVGLDFHTPEEFFLGQKKTSKFALPEFDPKNVDKKAPLLKPAAAKISSESQEVWYIFIASRDAATRVGIFKVFSPCTWYLHCNFKF